jgi:hypothetical protein
MENKIWYTSKTLWVNAIAVVAMVVQGVIGKEIIGIELQATILAVINMILRLVTKQPVAW